MFGYFKEGGKPEPGFCYGFRTKQVRRCVPKVKALLTSLQGLVLTTYPTLE